MKKRIKRVVAFLLATIMITSATCFATDIQETKLPPVCGQSGLMYHAYDNGAMATSQSMPDANTYLSFSEDAEVVYDYQLTYYNEDLTRVGVLLSFDISSQDDVISLTLNGNVQRIVVSEDLVILRGPLYTTERINGINYEISAGFTKVESRDAISVGLVFTSSDNNFQKLYSFGTPVLTDAEYATWRNCASSNIVLSGNDINDDEVVQFPMSTSTSGNFAYVKKDTGSLNVSGISTTASGTGSTLYALVDEENDRIMAGVETACYQLTQDKFPSGGYLAAGLYYMKVDFTRNGAKGNILGFDYVSLPTSGKSISLSTMFTGAASVVSLISPSKYAALVSAFLSALSTGSVAANPTVTYSKKDGSETRNAWVALSGMNAVNRVNFDNKMCPIVLSLANSGSSAGSSSWTVTLEMEYEVDLTYAAFYIPVTDAAVDVPVYFAG